MLYLKKQDIVSKSKPSQKKEEVMTAKQFIKLEKQFISQFELNNNQYFRGQISLPFFMLKVSDMQKYIMADNVLGRAFRDQLIEFISEKKVLNHDGPLDLNQLVYKINKQEKTIDQIREATNTKAIFAKYETSEEELKKNFVVESKKNPSY